MARVLKGERCCLLLTLVVFSQSVYQENRKEHSVIMAFMTESMLKGKGSFLKPYGSHGILELL